MNTSSALKDNVSPVVTRLSHLAKLDDVDVLALVEAERDQRTSSARREFVKEGQPLRERRALLSGWACRQRILLGGQRQILGFLLPGDLMGICHHTNPIAMATVLAVTDVVTCSVPGPDRGSGLREAYARSAAFEQHQFLAQITRLGRLNARERLVDWLLETRDRLMLAGLATTAQFTVPITQEMLADTLGLTPVHTNRTLQALRREGFVSWRGGTISLHDVPRLEAMVSYTPARVSMDGGAVSYG